MGHFTYKKQEGDLQQGDILKPNTDLINILREYHKYYADHKDYKYLIVLTQSCDLTLYNNKRKARYITLAAVRSLDTLIKRFLLDMQKSDIEKKHNFSSKKFKSKFIDFCHKLLNNNLPNYFYLHKDDSTRIYDPSVAFLKLSVSIKANEHYNKCLESRIAQLTDIFKAKLGWTVGNAYSRVGSPDWVPQNATKEEFDYEINQLLDKTVWVDDKELRYLKKKIMLEPSKDSIEDIHTIVTEYKKLKQSNREKVIDHIFEKLQKIVLTIPQNDIDKAKGRLMTSEYLSKFIK